MLPVAGLLLELACTGAAPLAVMLPLPSLFWNASFSLDEPAADKPVLPNREVLVLLAVLGLLVIEPD